MKARGDRAPSNAFTLEEMPKNPGRLLVRFYENAQPFEETRGRLTVRGYEYDEYHLEVDDTSGVEEYVADNYESLLEQAKRLEAADEDQQTAEQRIADLETENAALHEKVTALEGQVTDAQLALCDVYELMLGGDL